MPNEKDVHKIIQRLKEDHDTELMRYELEPMLERELAKPDSEIDVQLVDELLKTLYTYYICGNSVTRASDSLFIHRNTMHLRLKKIHSILSGDPDDPRTAEQYLLSLLLLRK